jgi:hypothetical protein
MVSSGSLVVNNTNHERIKSSQNVDFSEGLSYLVVYKQSAAGAGFESPIGLAVSRTEGAMLSISPTYGSLLKTNLGGFTNKLFNVSPVNRGLRVAAVRYEDTHNSHQFFVNGVEQTGELASGSGPLQSNLPLVIGQWGESSGWGPFIGAIYESHLWERYLSDTDFQLLQDKFLDKYNIGALSLSFTQSSGPVSYDVQIGPVGWAGPDPPTRLDPDFSKAYSNIVANGSSPRVLVDHLKAGRTYELRFRSAEAMTEPSITSGAATLTLVESFTDLKIYHFTPSSNVTIDIVTSN